MSEPEIRILTRYEVRVHASNRHAGYGTPVAVYADTKRAAVSRAIDVGWNGHRRDARVTIDRITQEVVVISECAAGESA